MMNRLSARLVPLVMLIAFLTPGCGKDSPSEPNGGLDPGEQAPDFALLDVNPNSSTSGQPISPRNYLNGVSAWYFGHAT